MEEKFLEKITPLTDTVMPLKNYFPRKPTEEELPTALIAAQVKELRAIRKILVFFTVLSIFGLVVGIIALLAPLLGIR